jgi:hypothetical protein
MKVQKSEPAACHRNRRTISASHLVGSRSMPTTSRGKYRMDLASSQPVHMLLQMNSARCLTEVGHQSYSRAYVGPHRFRVQLLQQCAS